MIKRKFNIISYSASALCFLSFQREAMAEAVYVDIDPDIEINTHLETAGIDMNNDGILDFGFLDRSFSFVYTTSFGNYLTDHVNVFFAGPQIFGNLIAGITVYLSDNMSTFFLPYALPQNAVIDEALSFQTDGYQVMAFRYRGLNTSYWGSGFWYPEKLDHYLGVYFIDSAACYHYGWIRCDIKDEVKTLIIKDYAYETKCDVGIIAGDTIGDTNTVGIDEINSLNATIYIFNNIIYIHLGELFNNIEVHVYDIAGKAIYTGQISEQSAQIKLNEAKGIYIIELIGEEGHLSKEVYLN